MANVRKDKRSRRKMPTKRPKPTKPTATEATLDLYKSFIRAHADDYLKVRLVNRKSLSESDSH